MALQPHQIGEYTGCTHGDGGARLYGCVICAIRWHEQQYEKQQAQADYHWNMMSRLKMEREEALLAGAEGTGGNADGA